VKESIASRASRGVDIGWPLSGLCFALLWLILQIPFLSIAFRVDETNILALARQVVESPFDPYGFQINWLGTSEEAFKVLANPPLVPIWLAAWVKVFPWNEASLHLAMIPFSLLALHAFDILARRFKVDRLVSLALLASSPAFFLASQVVMPDVAMFAFFLLAVAYGGLFAGQGRWLHWVLALAAALCCPIAKYNGIVLAPVLALELFRSRRKFATAVLAAAPAISLVAWNVLTWFKYGQPHFLAMAEFEKTADMAAPLSFLLFGVFSALGIGVLPLAMLPSLLKLLRKQRRIAVLVMVVFPALFWIGTLVKYPGTSAFLFALSITIALALVALSLGWGWQSLVKRDWLGVALVAWLWAGLAFQAGLMFTSVRYLLFLAPPAILLVLREMPHTSKGWKLWLPLAASFALTLSIATGDARIANGYRETVRNEIAPEVAGSARFFFAGHWGFQYYAEELGGQALDLNTPPVLNKGDAVVLASTPWPLITQPVLQAGQSVAVKTVEYDPGWAVRTIDCASAANFYGNLIYRCGRTTLLPWAFGQGPSESFQIYRIGGTWEPAGRQKPLPPEEAGSPGWVVQKHK
jgi:4-amino-4-deoxy-L-arabinose transferase-like glycosyltransferase